MKRIALVGRIGVMAMTTGMLTACDYVNDVPMLGRYIAKNVCHDVLVSGYDADASINYVTNVAPPFKTTWKVTWDAAAHKASVRNRLLPAYGTQTATPSADDLVYGCRNYYNGIVTGAPVPLPVADFHFEFGNGLGQFPALQDYVQAQLDAGAPAYTTAILVVQNNQVVAEAYRDGIGSHSPLKGFSMSKSVANLLLGRLADKGVLNIYDPMPIAEWQTDQRSAIQWDNSLRMSSGLQWHEASVGTNNQQAILFYGTSDPSAYALQQSYAVAPNTDFNYSSADFMNIATAMADTYSNWFDPGWDLGGAFALEFSPDRQHPLLAEGLSLTTRGWAQMAAVYMNGGKLGEQQILSPEWVTYSLTASATNDDYGAGIWLNQQQNLYPDVPADAFAFLGAYDRFVAAVPSRGVIVLRIGFSSQPGDFDMNGFLRQVLQLLPAQGN